MIRARTFLVHGVRVSLDGEAAEQGRALLAGFPAAPDGAADLAIVLRRVPAPVEADPGARPVFFHGRVRASERGGAISLRDGASALAVSPDGARIDGRVHAASLADGGHAFAQVTLLLAFVVALRRHGLFHAHAAALVAPDGTRLLLPGGGGAGKTTLALALLELGCEWLGDDAVFLAAGARRPEVLAFPRPFHVAERSARAFPRTAPHLGAATPNGKRWVDPASAYPRRQRHSMAAPDVLLFPEVSGAPVTSVEPWSCAEAAGALIEASALVVVDTMPAVPAQLEALRDVADGARSFRVRLGLDLLDDPPRVAAALLARTS